MAITADYYVDPVSGDDGNAGTSTGTAFATLQKAADTAAAGSVVALKANGTTPDELLTTAVAFDTNGGNLSAIIHFVGVNSSWVEDGTQYWLDGQNTATNIFASGGQDNIFFHNIRLHDATDSALSTDFALNEGCIFNNCTFDENGAGTDFNDWGPSICVRCKFFNNSGHGADGSYYKTSFIFCTAYSNTGNGIVLSSNSAYTNFAIGCLCYDNTAIGIHSAYGDNSIIGCTIDDNGSFGLSIDSFFGAMLANRITNNASYGIKTKFNTQECSLLGWNFLSGNSTATDHYNYHTIKDNTGADSNLFTGTIGYSDQPNRDYSLTESATLRRVPVSL